MTATMTEDVREQVLGVVRKSQELTLDAIKQVVETVNTAAEKLPAMPFVGKLHQLPRLPGVSALPTPETAVSVTFDFLGRLLADQRKFVEELIKATATLRPAAPAPASGEAAESAPAAE
jgi:ribosomal protein L12E/L44/L45/RPP1/RPP2